MRSEKENTTVCDARGHSRALVRRLPRIYGKGKDLLVIEEVPVIDCPRRGTSYLTAATLAEIERIKQHRKTLAAARSVAVANFT
jgi:hypothetical protein